MNVAYNMDCMEGMKQYPDKYFDLAVVDPPYGDALADESGGGVEQVRRAVRQVQDSASTAGARTRTTRGTSICDHLHSSCRKRERERDGGDPDGRHMGGEVRKKIIAWDTAPEKEYFEQLFRVSRNQIIWGGNYFDLPPTRCFLVWRKLNIPLSGFSMAPCEYAWTSFQKNAAMFEAYSTAKPHEPRFHPTQKPVELYAWIYNLYAKPGDKILDTHLGSGSSRIAAYDAGLDFVGYELDPYYFKMEEERFNAHTPQQSLFVEPEQEVLFDG